MAGRIKRVEDYVDLVTGEIISSAEAFIPWDLRTKRAEKEVALSLRPEIRIFAYFVLRFSNKLLREGLKFKDSRLTFHSFRHGMADTLRISTVTDAVRHAILGHAEQGTPAAYGSGELASWLLVNAVNGLPSCYVVESGN